MKYPERPMINCDSVHHTSLPPGILVIVFATWES